VIPGARNVGEGLFRLPRSWAACAMLRGIFGDDLEIGEHLTEWAEHERQRRVDGANEARAADDGPEYTPAEDVDRSGETREGRAIIPERQWWWEIWRGMPEYVHRDIGPWKTVKVHVRNREDFDRLQKAIGVKINMTKTAAMPACWFPAAEELSEDAWRYVDEDADPATIPHKASAMAGIPLTEPKERPNKSPKRAKKTDSILAKILEEAK
jgi:hypothetical protein